MDDFSAKTLLCLIEIINGQHAIVGNCDLAELVELIKISEKYLITDLTNSLEKEVSGRKVTLEDIFEIGRIIGKHEHLNHGNICDLLREKSLHIIQEVKETEEELKVS